MASTVLEGIFKVLPDTEYSSNFAVVHQHVMESYSLTE